jgi:hypothetical protein
MSVWCLRSHTDAINALALADDEVTYLSPLGAVTGSLYVTNFKLVFLGPTDTHIEVLLGLVEKMDKVGLRWE